MGVPEAAMEEHIPPAGTRILLQARQKRIAASPDGCLLPRYARILKPGTYGSP